LRAHTRLLAALILSASTARAQASAPGATEPPASIQDNSFLIEEAYNQEPGVVQHISTFLLDRRSRSWSYAFTQEWPLGSQRHQFSFSVPVQRVDGETGFGDVALNYRFQLLGAGEEPTYAAPRVSVLLPTGDERRGLGAGGHGVQASLPLSVAAGRRVVTHWNAAVTVTPHAVDPAGRRGQATGFALGQSVVWLAHPLVNALVETVWSRSELRFSEVEAERRSASFISPGVRCAINRAGGLQVVPGLGVPIGIGPSRGEWALLAYLSVEHGF
jgi:hypothetical protein